MAIGVTRDRSLSSTSVHTREPSKTGTARVSPRELIWFRLKRSAAGLFEFELGHWPKTGPIEVAK